MQPLPPLAAELHIVIYIVVHCLAFACTWELQLFSAVIFLISVNVFAAFITFFSPLFSLLADS